jgi:F0F1-type ATP synthase assembly protein I
LRNQTPSGAELAGLGVFVAAAFIGPFITGLVLDAIVHSSPLFLFIGLIVGIAAATFGLYLRLKRYF